MKRLILLITLSFLAFSCRDEKHATSAQSPAAQPAQRDPHSFSRPDEVRVEHIVLDLGVDFAKKQLAGTATVR